MTSGLNRKHYPSLDGLRGIGFLIVFVAHVGQAYKSFYIAGKVGVGLFLVLSAFLLTQFFLAHLHEMHTVRDWVRYAWKRITRLYPMYIVVLLAELAFGRFSVDKVISHLLLLDGRQHYWTIPVEFQFYALMPFIAIVLFRILKGDVGKSLLFLVSAIVGAGLLYPQITGPFVQPLASQLHIVFYLPAFLVGIVLAILVKMNDEKKFILSARSAGMVAVLSAFIIVALFPYSFELFWKAGVSRTLFWLFTGYSLLWSGIIFFLTTQQSALYRVLEHPAIRHLGNISYSAYLIHIMAISLSRHIFADVPIAGYAMSFFLTLALSSLAYFLIEKPAMRFGILKL